MFPFKNRSILYPDMVVHKTSLDNIWRSCLHEEKKKKQIPFCIVLKPLFIHLIHLS